MSSARNSARRIGNKDGVGSPPQSATRHLAPGMSPINRGGVIFDPAWRSAAPVDVTFLASLLVFLYGRTSSIKLNGVSMALRNRV